MKKEKYECSDLEVIIFMTEDVLTTSNCDKDEYEGWNPTNPGGSGDEPYEGWMP